MKGAVKLRTIQRNSVWETLKQRRPALSGATLWQYLLHRAPRLITPQLHNSSMRLHALLISTCNRCTTWTHPWPELRNDQRYIPFIYYNPDTLVTHKSFIRMQIKSEKDWSLTWFSGIQGPFDVIGNHSVKNSILSLKQSRQKRPTIPTGEPLRVNTHYYAIFSRAQPSDIPRTHMRR